MSDKNYVKLFEELDQEGALTPDPEPEDVEIVNSIDKDHLTAGQKRALDRGDDLLTPAQYAACYVRAQEAVAKSEDTRGRGDTSLTRSAKNVSFGQETEDWKKAPVDKLAFYMGRKPSTVSWTVRKFKDLLQGNREGSESNQMYQLILDYFDLFQRMSTGDVMNGAELAITETPNDEEWSTYRDKQNQSSKASAEQTKMERANIRPEIRKNVLGLKNAGESLTDAVRLAVAGLAQLTGQDKKTIAQEGMLAFKEESFIREEFRKLLKKL
jgi:hypothetical protein